MLCSAFKWAKNPSKSGPDYGMGIVGKCLGPATSKGPRKDGCKIFWAYVSHAVSNVLCSLSTELSIDVLLTRQFHLMTWPDEGRQVTQVRDGGPTYGCTVPRTYAKHHPGLLKIAPSLVDIWTLSQTWFLLPTRVQNPNGIATCAAVFAGSWRWRTDRETNRPRYSVCNNRPHLRRHCDAA